MDIVAAGRPLTPRMRDVVAAGSRGLTITQTARELGIAESTVATLRAGAVERAGAPNFLATVVAFVKGELG